MGNTNQKPMKRTYHISNMTCTGCTIAITKELLKVHNVANVAIDLDAAEATIQMHQPISLEVLKLALPKKYAISEREEKVAKNHDFLEGARTSKLRQLQPLLLIFLYLTVTVVLLNFKTGSIKNAMLDFMGLFYVVFSFFKLLDLKGFPDSFRMYDPLAKRIPIYAWGYPFIELALGVLFLMRYQLGLALVATVIILGITTIGVAKTLLDKKTMRCACLGTALKLPMTEATLIENSLMLVMALTMLFLA